MPTFVAEGSCPHTPRCRAAQRNSSPGRWHIRGLASLLLLLGLVYVSAAGAAAGDLSATAGPRDEEDLEPFSGRRKFDSEIELTARGFENIALGQRSHDNKRSTEQELALAWSFGPSARLSALAEIKLVAEQEVFADATPRVSNEGVERGETWLYFKRLFGGNAALKVGNQNFAEPRRWWWDDDLDAVRLNYADERWRLYVGLAEALGRTSSAEDFIDPEDEDVRRLLAHASWRLSKGFNVAAFYLKQHDGSKSQPVDSVIESARQDESDADLRWLGLRATGDVSLSRGGALSYWADIAAVRGEETLLEFVDESPGVSRVSSVQRRRVRGRALDVGLVWTLARLGEPALTVSYARGSGDDNLGDDRDRAFRQTGLQDEDEEFRYYGELLRPELSNLSVATVAIGFPVHSNTRLTLGLHRFRQVESAAFLREARIDASPTGESRDIGSEISLVAEIREWEKLTIDIAGGSFEAGDAFGVSAGRRAKSLFFKLIYEF